MALGIPCVRGAAEDADHGSQRPTYRYRKPLLSAAALILAIDARALVFWRISKDGGCTGPSTLPLLPLAVVAFHSLHDVPISYSNPEKKIRQLEDSSVSEVRSPIRYALPCLLLAASGFWLTSLNALIRTTHICPLATDAPRTISRLAFLGFILDCTVILLVFALLNDRNGKAHQDAKRPANVAILGSSLIVGSTTLHTKHSLTT